MNTLLSSGVRIGTGGQESGVVGQNGNVHVMCLTFKTIQNDTAQCINE